MLVPVAVIVPWQATVHPPDPGTPEDGETLIVAAATVTALLIESVVSVMVRVPTPLPVDTTTVSDVAELLVLLTREAPITPDTEKFVLPVQLVALPTQASVMFPEWFAGIVLGAHVKLGITLN